MTGNPDAVREDAAKRGMSVVAASRDDVLYVEELHHNTHRP